MAVVPVAPTTPTDITGGTQRQLDKTESTASAAVPSAEQPETTKEDTLSPQYAALARRERALRRQIQALRQKETELKAKEEQSSRYVDPDKFKQELRQRAQVDPMGMMQEFGLSYDQLTNLMLNQPSAEQQEIARLKQEIQTIKEAQGKTNERFDQEQQKAYDQAVKQIRSEAENMVSSDSRFETVKEMGQVEAAVELIKLNFEKEGTLMSIEEALESVEDYLIDEAVRVAKLKKVQAKLTPAQEQAVAEAVQTQTTASAPKTHAPSIIEKTQPMKTLTHRDTVSVTKPLSGKDRRERAILAFQGLLNK